MASSTAPPATTATAQANGQPKKLHGRAFYESIGSPKYIVAPMVDQSEFAWRMLTRSFLPADQRGSVLAYTPMLHARLFVDSPRYRTSHFEATRPGEDEETENPAAAYLDGNPAMDRPLFVQFCANDPEALLAAARRVEAHCDAVDLNLGCPQGIARKGHYGAFLQEDPALIARLVRVLHDNLRVPVTAKMRVLDTPGATLQYARTLLEAGASILTVHGRRREQKGHLTGLADWGILRYLRDHLPADTVLFANGNVLQARDLARCLAATGFDGVMSAEGLLSDPGLFGPMPAPTAAAEAATEVTPTEETPSKPFFPTPDPRREYWSDNNSNRGGWRVDAVMRRYLDILHVYGLGASEPPARRPLFLPGDEMPGEPAPETTAAEAGGRKRKRDDAGAGAGKPSQDFASPNFIGVQAHLFHLLRHAVARHHDVRDRLARTRKGDMAGYERILAMLEQRVATALVSEGGEEEKEEEGSSEKEEEDNPLSSEAAVRRCRRPWWVVQPVIRPMPAEALAKGAIQLKKSKRARVEEQAAASKADKASKTTQEAAAS